MFKRKKKSSWNKTCGQLLCILNILLYIFIFYIFYVYVLRTFEKECYKQYIEEISTLKHEKHYFKIDAKLLLQG